MIYIAKALVILFIFAIVGAAIVFFAFFTYECFIGSDKRYKARLAKFASNKQALKFALDNGIVYTRSAKNMNVEPWEEREIKSERYRVVEVGNNEVRMTRLDSKTNDIAPAQRIARIEDFFDKFELVDSKQDS